MHFKTFIERVTKLCIDSEVKQQLRCIGYGKSLQNIFPTKGNIKKEDNSVIKIGSDCAALSSL